MYEQRTPRGVERGDRTEWQRPLIINMAHRDSQHRGHADEVRAFTDDGLDRSRAVIRVFVAIGEVPECERDTGVKGTTLPQLRQHAIDTIRRLVDILEHDDRTMEIDGPRRAAQ